MAEPVPTRPTGKFMEQGHTSSPQGGNDPMVEAKGVAGQPAKELKGPGGA